MPRASEITSFLGDPATPTLQAVSLTLAAIDEVHTLPRSAILFVRECRTRRTNGTYQSTRSESLISISKLAAEPEFTFAHEFCHLLDDRILNPRIGVLSSNYDSDLLPLLSTCIASPEVRTVNRVLSKYHASISKSDGYYIAEALRPEELLSRVYAQWLAIRCGHPVLLAQLARRIANKHILAGISCIFQWEQESFKPIMEAVDQLFILKGLL